MTKCPKCGRERSQIALYGAERWYCYMCDNPMHSPPSPKGGSE